MNVLNLIDIMEHKDRWKPSIFVNFTIFPSQSYRSTQKKLQEFSRSPDILSYILEENGSMRIMFLKH